MPTIDNPITTLTTTMCFAIPIIGVDVAPAHLVGTAIVKVGAFWTSKITPVQSGSNAENCIPYVL
jgi:hypothetical protein